MKRLILCLILLSLLGLCSCVKIITRKKSQFSANALSTFGYWKPQDVHYAYVTNRVSNSITAYRAQPGTGAQAFTALPKVSTGENPIALLMHPLLSVGYVLNYGKDDGVGDLLNGGTISGYSVDLETGVLTPLAGSPFSARFEPEGASPIDMAFGGAQSEFLYVTFEYKNVDAESQHYRGIWVYKIDPNSGALSRIQIVDDAHDNLMSGRITPQKLISLPGSNTLLATNCGFSNSDSDNDLDTAGTFVVDVYSLDPTSGKVVAWVAQSTPLLTDDESRSHCEFDRASGRLLVGATNIVNADGNTNYYEELISFTVDPRTGVSTRKVLSNVLPAYFDSDHNQDSYEDSYNTYQAHFAETSKGTYWFHAPPRYPEGETASKILAFKLPADGSVLDEQSVFGTPTQSNVIPLTTMPVRLGAASPDASAFYHVYTNHWKAANRYDDLEKSLITYQPINPDTNLADGTVPIQLSAELGAEALEFVAVQVYVWDAGSGFQISNLMQSLFHTMSGPPPASRVNKVAHSLVNQF